MCSFHKQMNATNSTVDTMRILARKQQDFHLSHKQHQEQNFPEKVNLNRTMWAENHTIKHWKKKKPPVSEAPETPTRRWCSCTSRSRPESVSPSQQRERERECELCIFFFFANGNEFVGNVCQMYGMGYRKTDRYTYMYTQRGKEESEKRTNKKKVKNCKDEEILFGAFIQLYICLLAMQINN